MIARISRRSLELVKTTIDYKFIGKARVLVQVGEKIVTSSALAVVEMDAGEKQIDLSLVLGVSPDQIGQFVQVRQGSKVLKGEVVARKPRSLLSKEKVYISPMDGFFDSLENGIFVLKFPPQIQRVKAEFSGVVKKVNSDSIEVELGADLLSGQVCIGPDVRGELYKIAGQGEILNPDRLDNQCAGKIVFGGQMLSKEFLERAKNLDVKAVLCGGIDQSLAQELLKSDAYPTLLMIEGYGNFALGRDIFELLVRREKKVGFIDARHNRLVVPSLETVRHDEETLATFKPLVEFDRVRVLDFVRGSEVGTVTSIKKIFNQKALLPTEVALVKLDTGKMTETFASNLEILIN